MLSAYPQFERLHSGLYHDTWQAQTASKLASSMATQAGFSRKDSRFLAQVALLHNADERLDTQSSERKPHLPPKVHNTIDWLLDQRDSICRNFLWTKHNFHMACYLVARTASPFDGEPRQVGRAFRGKSPVEMAAHFLNELPAEMREGAVRLGLILRFADQIANFTGNQKRIDSSLAGMVKEIAATGVKVSLADLGIASYLKEIGTDLNQDRALALRFGISRDGLLGREALLALLPNPVRRRFEANLAAMTKVAVAA